MRRAGQGSHLVVVAAQHDPDNVLADVVDVALDRRQQHDTRVTRVIVTHTGLPPRPRRQHTQQPERGRTL